MYLPRDVSRTRLTEAEDAGGNVAKLASAIAKGEVTRRDFIKWGLTTSGGLLVPVHGLNPFTQPMPRFDVLPTALR